MQCVKAVYTNVLCELFFLLTYSHSSASRIDSELSGIDTVVYRDSRSVQEIDRDSCTEAADWACPISCLTSPRPREDKRPTTIPLHSLTIIDTDK